MWVIAEFAELTRLAVTGCGAFFLTPLSNHEPPAV
jgi:hypothetical protein